MSMALIEWGGSPLLGLQAILALLHIWELRVASGIVELWVDGKPMLRRSLEKGHFMGTEASIILGQKQISLLGEE